MWATKTKLKKSKREEEPNDDKESLSCFMALFNKPIGLSLIRLI